MDGYLVYNDLLDMKVSLNTIKQYIDFELPPVDELVERINQQLGGVEEIIDLASKYKDAKIVRVVECAKHENADKLSVCKVDAGTGELVQVVCGAPNVRADMWAVWLPPESTVPSTFEDEAPFVLGARELRGVMSNGMLASARELALGDDHDGIVEIVERDLPAGKSLTPGGTFAETFGLNDTVIDIENKMFTHRPDLFGQLGVAREIAGIFGKQFEEKDWYWKLPEFEQASGLELDTFNDAEEKVPRIMFVAMNNIEVRPSPLWLQCALVAMGSKPINNIVDVTNYVMLLTAQPTHAYDYDKIRGHKIGARMATEDETIELLNGKSYKLTTDDIVIADAEGAIGLGGIMGGGNSEVSNETKNIILEVATFDMYAVRKSAMRYGIFTDALTRFNKGQSSLQNDRIINLLLSNIKNMSSAERASNVFDLRSSAFDARGLGETMKVEASFINERLGLDLSNAEIGQLLSNVQFYVDEEEGAMKVTAPFWRTDIELPEDIVEEVGRLYGFEKLPRELPRRSTKPAPKNSSRVLAQNIREILSKAGANEVLTYSFVHENIIKKSGQDTDEAYKISNALSPDLQYYRLSLTPSLLSHVHNNIKSGYRDFALFEIGKTHSKRADLDSDGLPSEMRRVALTVASRQDRTDAPYYNAKTILEFLATKLDLKLVFKPISSDTTLTMAKPFEASRSARAIDVVSGQTIGIVGEYTVATRQTFKLPDYSAGFELLPQAIEMALEKVTAGYKPLSKYPSTDRDISFKVSEDVSYQQVVDLAESGLADSGVDYALSPADIYQAEGDSKKTITINVRLTPFDRTLQSEDANKIVATLTESVVNGVGAEVV